ncbi:MAG: AsmA family protein [Asticcacaulis sp.]
MVKLATDKHDNGLHGHIDDLWAGTKLRAHQAWTWLKGCAAAVWAWIKGLPRAVQWVAGAVIVLIVAAILFLTNPDWDWARGTVASLISSKTHRPVQITGHLRVHLFRWTPDATLSGLHIGQPAKGIAGAPKANMADIGAVGVTAEMLPLFAGHIVLPRLQVDKPNVVLFQDQAGHANWDFSNGADKGKPIQLPLIRNFIINDGHLDVNSVQRKLHFTGTVNAHEKADSGRTAFALIGNGSLNGNVFALNATGGPLLNVRSAVPYPFNMDVRAGDTHITANGRVVHPFNLGQLDGAITLSGSNLADLYYLTGLTLPDTSRYSLAANVTRNDMLYTIDRINGRVGGSDLEGALKVDTRDHGRPDLTGDLRSRVLDFKDLGSLFGATAANAPSAPKLTATPDAVTPARHLLPDAPLDVERVRGMDAKVHYRALSVRTTSVPLRQVSLGVTLDHGLLVLDPIDFMFPQGHLTGTARLDARGAVQQNAIDMRVTGLGIQDFVPAFQGSKPVEGTLNARVRATGAGHSIHDAASSANGDLTVVMPAGTLRQSLAELAGVDASKGLFLYLAKNPHQTDVRCAIADFQIQNGVMQTRNITLDTGVVLVTGTGRINLNDESMKFVFKGKPKKFRLIRVNAPIIIGGHMAAPTLGINAGPAVAQTGLAAIFHSIIPFLGLDLAKDANCSALLSEARAQGASTTTPAH